MKNLHLIPTDKPSRLIKNNHSQLLLTIQTLPLDRELGCFPQNIYITSDEFIEEGDFGLNLSTKNIVQYDGIKGLDSYYKKIILTTDQDLIKDGVQGIDDGFLEWFIKNPSCESVEVEDTCLEVKVCDCAMNENCLKPGYTIIIPKEELKQELNLNCFDCNKSLQDCTCIEDTLNMKQETLEEVATKVLDRKYPYHRPTDAGYWKDMFISGAKWQEERSYSEEDMLKFGKYLLELSNSVMSRKFNIGMLDLETGTKLTKDLFEQFKKK